MFEKAARAIRAAQRLLDDKDKEFSAGRAYYAMFYAAEALLNEKALRFILTPVKILEEVRRAIAARFGVVGSRFARTYNR